IRVGIIGDVGAGPHRAALRDHAVLIARLRFKTLGGGAGAKPAAAAAPARLARIVSWRVKVRHGRAADRYDIFGDRWENRRRPAVPGRGQERYAVMPGGGYEVAVVRVLAGELAGAPAHRDYVDPGRLGCGLHRREQVREIGGLGLEQADRGLGSDRVRPFDVQRDLGDPAAVGRWVSGAASLIVFVENRIRQAVGKVKLVQVTGYVRVVVGIHD